ARSRARPISAGCPPHSRQRARSAFPRRPRSRGSEWSARRCMPSTIPCCCAPSCSPRANQLLPDLLVRQTQLPRAAHHPGRNPGGPDAGVSAEHLDRLADQLEHGVVWVIVGVTVRQMAASPFYLTGPERPWGREELPNGMLGVPRVGDFEEVPSAEDALRV